MENKDSGNLEQGCIFEGLFEGVKESSLENIPCNTCITKCYRPKNMSPEKEAGYKSGCLSINGIDTGYNPS